MRTIWKNRDPNRCESVDSLLSPYIDRQTSPGETRLVEAHLERCTACRTRLEELRLVSASLRALPVAAVPRSFRLRPDQVRRPSPVRQPSFIYLRGAVAALAAVLVLLIGAGPLLSPPLRMAAPTTGDRAWDAAPRVAAPAPAARPESQMPKASSDQEATALEAQPSPAAAPQTPSAPEPMASPAPPGLGEGEPPATAARAPEPAAGPAQAGVDQGNGVPAREELPMSGPDRTLWALQLAVAVTILVLSVGAFLNDGGRRVGPPHA